MIPGFSLQAVGIAPGDSLLADGTKPLHESKLIIIIEVLWYLHLGAIEEKMTNLVITKMHIKVSFPNTCYGLSS